MAETPEVLDTRDAATVSKRSSDRARLLRLIFALSGCVPVLLLFARPPAITLLIYSVFVTLWFVREPARAWVRGLRAPIAVTFAVLVLLAAFMAEVLAWLDNFVVCTAEPALLHPQLVPDLGLAILFYGTWTIAWLTVTRWFRYATVEVIAVQGAYGILAEGLGVVFIQGLLTFPVGLLLWAYVALVYGSIIGGPYLLVESELSQRAHRTRWLKIPVAFGALMLTFGLFALVYGGILEPAMLIPPKRPICEHPFW